MLVGFASVTPSFGTDMKQDLFIECLGTRHKCTAIRHVCAQGSLNFPSLEGPVGRSASGNLLVLYVLYSTSDVSYN